MTTTTTTQKIPCYLGIDVGTQGLTALLVESSESDGERETQSLSSLDVLAMGEGSYGFVPNLPEGCYEQDPREWETALFQALRSILEQLKASGKQSEVAIGALCVTGQMHGCVMVDRDGRSIGTSRLWCDARNQEEVGC
jgi:xylulokinase